MPRKDIDKSFLKKLIKYFILPFLLFFSMALFPDNISIMMIIASLIVLYFFLIALVWFIKFLISLFHLKKIKIFKEDKMLVFQFFEIRSGR